MQKRGKFRHNLFRFLRIVALMGLNQDMKEVLPYRRAVLAAGTAESSPKFSHKSILLLEVFFSKI